MRSPRVLTVMVAFLALAWAGSALAASSTMTYQGRLATTTGTPVADGSYSVTFTLWTDSLGGSMLWTESQSVQVSGGEGLFTCQLGTTQPLGGPLVNYANDDLYLQTAVSGQTLLPRQQLGTVPCAFSSTSVSADVAGTGSMQLQVGDDTTKMVSSHQSFTNVLDSYVHLTDDKGMLGLKCFGAGQPHPQSCNGMEVDEDESLSLVAVDVDHDGVQDVGTTSSAKIPRSVVKTFFQRSDVPTESQITDSVDETGAYSGAIRYTGTDFEGHRVSLMPESAVVSTEVSNPDVSSSSHMRVRLDALESKLQALGLLASSRITQTLTPTTCGVAINTKGTGADKGRTISSTCDDSSAVQLAEVDDDGDGLVEARGIIVTKGGSGTGTPSASSTISTDPDEDGVADFASGGSVDDTSSQWSVTKVAAVPGNHRDGWNVICVDGLVRSDLRHEFQNGDIPNQQDFVDSRGAFSRAINTKGSGATVRVSLEATDSASGEYATDSDGDGTMDSKANIAAVLNGNVVVECLRDTDDDGTADVSAETEVSDDSATFRLTAMPPGLPASSAITMGAGSLGVHMEVGAATCDGTNWNNASDQNLKENFKAVDGEVLLQKISGLPITQWNYKGDTQNEHIGPTAQDFKATFGVGSDGKSISTIDPSGVALAAIQQLIRENEDLRARIAKLEQAQSEERAK